ncbi:MAG TPA: hypothetical protein VK849_02425 [Longimicrobiales bacterium]|nr:hypothetical protein [Longimicrobiales bacterium]
MALVALLAIVVLYSIYVARLVLMPVTLALLASLLLAPVVARVRRFGVPRSLAAGMVVSALLAAGAYGA